MTARQSRWWASTVLLLLVLGPLSVCPARAEDPAFPFAPADLPTGWRIEKEIVIPPAQLAGFAQRLGGRVESLTNQIVSVNGLSVRVNAVVAASPKDAEAIEKAMSDLRGADFVARRNATVFEVAGQNALLAPRVFAALGVGPDEPTVWDVTFRIGLIDALNYTSGNRVFNHFLQLERNPDDAAAREAIAEETRSWTFGDTLRLRRSHPPVEWSFEPEPVSRQAGSVSTTYRFEDPPRLEGVPYVKVTGRVSTAARFPPVSSPPALPAAERRRLTSPTPAWPSASDLVLQVARSATEGVAGEGEKVLALLRAVSGRVAYGGAMGTRDGVLTVLQRGYGRCWDRSDVLIALCRAVGLPARQVGGWVPPIRAGHIWTEIRVDGGWIPVDATTTWLGASGDYVPLFATEEGAMPILYLSMPQIRRRAGEPGGDEGR